MATASCSDGVEVDSSTSGAGGSGGEGGAAAGGASPGGAPPSQVGKGGAPPGELCSPGAEEACYAGPAGTEGVGLCRAGKRTCEGDGSAWGPCEGEVLPSAEVCDNGEDEDCSGAADDAVDGDGDGASSCEEDCDDSDAAVNAGAFDVPGNGKDDDCDGVVDPPAEDCGGAAKFSGTTGEDIARAMDICRAAAEGDGKWGVLSAALLRADGSAAASLSNEQSAVLEAFGTGIHPVEGATMAGLSTGRMRDKDDPSYAAPQPGTSMNAEGQPPAAYLAAHGGALPATTGCAGSCTPGAGANDSALLRLVVRAPTNASGFSFRFKFLSADYGSYSCTQFNDYFLALLGSAASGLPADRNISTDAAGSPLTVNSSFIEVCPAKGCYACSSGALELAGTGFEDAGTGGATRWLTSEAPVVPGETLTLDLTVFDVQDGVFDSAVLLDAFAWRTHPTAVSTHD